jgi:hypothetical protein
MIIEVFHHRKPRSDSALKSFSQEIQDEIVHYAHDHSLREVQAWLQEKHHVKRALSTISDFLSWSRTIERRYGNQGAIEALVTPLGADGPESTDTPELTDEEVRTHARRYFLETIVHDCNISAWHQCERIAVNREELELKQQQLELKRQELELKREELELKRKIHERNSDESVVNTDNAKKETPNTKHQTPNNHQQSINDSQESDHLQPSTFNLQPATRNEPANPELPAPEKRQSLSPNVEPLNRGIVESGEEVPSSRFDGFDAFDGSTMFSVNRGKSCKIVANRIKRSGVQSWRPVKTRPTCCQTQLHSNQSRLHQMKVDKGEKMYADAGYHPGYA